MNQFVKRYRNVFNLQSLIILMMLFINGSSGWVSAAYQNIADAVGVDYAQINYIMSSYKTILTVASTYVGGIIAGKMISYKKMAIGSTFIYGASALVYLFFPTYAGVWIGCTLWGIGMGCIACLPFALAIGFSKDENYVSTMSGWGLALNKVGTTLVPLLSATLCLIKWNYVFLPYLYGFVLCIIIIFSMPDLKYEDKEEKKKNFGKMSISGWAIASIAFFAYLLNIPTVYSLSKYVVGGGLGTAVDAATCMSLMSLPGIFVGFLFTEFNKIFKKYLYPVLCIFITIGMFLMYRSDSLNMLRLACLVIGIGFPMTNAAVAVIGDRHIKKEEAGVFSGTMQLMCNLGVVLGPFWMTFCQNLTGSDHTVMLFGTIGFVILAIFIIILEGKTKKLDTE